MTRLVVERAKNKGYWICKAECSSAFSSKAIVKQGGVVEKSIDYRTFKLKGSCCSSDTYPFTAAQEPHTQMDLVVFRHKEPDMDK